MFLNGGFVVALDESDTCVNSLSKRALAGFLSPAERLKDFRGWSAQTVARGTSLEEPETGKTL